jgi:hypothetical protein
MSMAQPQETFEFLSPEWLAAVQRIAERLLGKLDAAGVDFTVSEELTAPPAGRARTAAGTLGWFLRIRNGVVQVGDQPLEDADMRVVADYDTHHDLSRRVWAGDPEAMATSGRLREEATKEGRLRTEGGIAQAPDVVRQLVADLHDPVAEITK